MRTRRFRPTLDELPLRIAPSGGSGMDGGCGGSTPPPNNNPTGSIVVTYSPTTTAQQCAPIPPS
jgi:hypothetical protein